MLADVDELPPHAGVEVDLALPEGTLDRFAALQRRHGDVFRVDSPRSAAATYVVADPELAADVFSRRHHDYRRFILDGRSALLLGQGLLISEGDLWRAQRKLLQRCFHGQALTGMRGIMVRCNAALLERWCAHADAGLAVDLTGDTLQASLDFNLQSMFGSDAGTLQEHVGADFLHRLTAPGREDTRSNLLFMKQTRQARARIGALVAERRGRGDAGSDLLGMMMQARPRDGGEAMTDERIVDETLSILTAGHETVATLLKSAWYEIARDRALGDALRAEADRVLGHADPHEADLDGLRFTKQVVLETMRLHPPIWVIARQALVDTRIGRWPVPAGSNVLVCAYLVHRHPAHWPDASRFDPARFGDDAVAARHTHAHLPFSKGPRHCIGDAMSMDEVLLHIATVARSLRITHVSGAPGDYAASFLLRSQAPLLVRIDRVESP